MSPNLATNDHAYEDLGDIKCAAKGDLCFAGSVSRAYLPDGSISEFGIAIARTARARVGADSRSPLRLPVCRIRGVATQPKMIRPNTRRIVAMVANAHVRWYRAVVQFPREAMRAVGSLTSDGHFPVAVPVSATVPSPALAGLVYLRPKPFFNRYAGILSGHLELILRGVMRATVDAVRPLLSISRPLSAGAALTLGAGMVAI